MNVDDAPSARPFAYADPRSLSQAWYDALYGERARPAVRPQNEPPSKGPAAAAYAPQPRAASPESGVADAPAGAVAAAARSATPRAGGAADARTAPEDARSKRAAPAPRPDATEATRTDVELDDPAGGTVRLLVAEHGGELQVIAVCEREARERTADALARARIALAARGVALHSDIRERGTS